jgi:uncharacterized protein YbaA (DUF1428 family)
MPYVDAFVLAVSKKNLPAYTRLARAAGKVWQEHGALEYRECVSDDLSTPCGTPYTKLLNLKRGEAALFSWIVYRSRAHRDRVNKAVMSDARILAMIGKKMPFDMQRMSHGGFRTLVDLVAKPAKRASRPR